MTCQSCATCALLCDALTGERPAKDAPEWSAYMCGWEPPPLPHSWHFARREVIGVNLDDGADCACYVAVAP